MSQNPSPRGTGRFIQIAIVVVSGLVGLNAIVPGWQLMTSGSVYGYKLPTDWLSSYWPFADYTVAGLVLLVVIGAGGVATAIAAALSARMAPVLSLVGGLVLVGWIAFELIFLTQTMIMTWIILGAGLALIALAAPFWLTGLSRDHRRGRRIPAA
ncbi:MAG TPA: hypothetical protein VNG93_10035 [Candidatus Dormibacteraeota bacterium]|nr:hypothetical protein [Candidatus Dormibacteraeota bacterium]